MNRDSGRHALDMAAPALAFAAVFLFLRAANQTPDGLSYARAVRTGVDMFHPHHLIYVPTARLIHQAGGGDPITATLLQNLGWLVVLAFAAWRLAGRILPGRAAPVLAACGLLSLRGVMIYSVRVETYLPALACLTLAAALAMERPVRPWFLAPVISLAILYHQTNVLFIAPLLVLLAEDRRQGWGRPVMALATATLAVLAVYMAAARNAGEGFWAFALDYARAPIEAWGNFDNYSFQGLSQLAASQLRMILPVRDAATVAGGVAMLAVLVVLVVWHVLRIRRGAAHRLWRKFSLIYLAVYLLFFLWWMPSDQDFFVATLLPLWLLGVITVTDLPSSWVRPQPAVVLVAVLAAGNIFFTILPMHSDAGPGRRLALALDRAAPAGAEMVVGYAVQQEMLYFTKRTRVHEFDGLARAVLEGEAPWSNADTEAVVVIEGIFLRDLLGGEEGAAGPFQQWLAGYDPETKNFLEVRPVAGVDAFQMGPGFRQAGSWNEIVRAVRDLTQP